MSSTSYVKVNQNRSSTTTSSSSSSLLSYSKKGDDRSKTTSSKNDSSSVNTKLLRSINARLGEYNNDSDGNEDNDDDDDVDDDDESDESSIQSELINFKGVLIRRTSSYKEKQLEPPLPLFKFENRVTELQSAKTITGEDIDNLDLGFHSSLHGSILEQSDKDLLQSPVRSRRLMKWFIARGFKEANLRQMESYSSMMKGMTDTGDCPTENLPQLIDYPVYDHMAFCNEDMMTEDEQCPNSQNDMSDAKVDSSTSTSSPSPPTQSLSFDSFFESGNLQKAVRVTGRDSLLTGKSFEHMHEYDVPMDVDQEYDLTLRKDLNTSGNIQWYYFKVVAPLPKDNDDIAYPLRVRFNLVNMQKKDSLYNYGMKPTVYSTANKEQGWKHVGDDICYYKNGLTVVKASNSGKGKKKKVLHQYSLSFTHTFMEADSVYFAHCFPYTYTHLQEYLHDLEQNERLASMMHRKLLCTTLVGNRCDLLIITERCKDIEDNRSKPVVIVSARIHPGESNSSFMMHGFIDFLLSECEEASKLRKTFVFKLVPMLNPDGVIHGNYRCSLAGTDLNRRYLDANPIIHPTVTAFKELLKASQDSRGVLLYLDLHGHSKKKNSFLYGCDITQQSDSVSTNFNEDECNDKKIFSRLFPSVLCQVSNSETNGYFSFSDCRFGVDKSKLGTGRVVTWNKLFVEAAYTVEASFCSNGNNKEGKVLKQVYDSGKWFQADKGESGDSPRHRRQIQKLDEILEQYKKCYHYRKSDFIDAGRHIGIAIYHFANLQNVKDVEGSIAYSRLNAKISSKIAAEKFLSPEALSLMCSDLVNNPKARSIESNGPDMINRTLLQPSLFSREAVQLAMTLTSDDVTSSHSDPIGHRIKSEVLLRKMLKIPYAKVDGGILFPELLTAETVGLDNADVESDNDLEAELEEDGEDGSDSDPSVDTRPIEKLFSNKKKKKIIDSKTLLKSLRKTVVKEIKKERKIEKEQRARERERVEKEVVVAVPKDPPILQFPRLKKIVQLRKKQILACNVINTQYNPPYKYQTEPNVDRSPLLLTVQNIVLDDQSSDAPMKSARPSEFSLGHKIVSNDDLTEAFKAEIRRMKEKEKPEAFKVGMMTPTSPSQSMISPNSAYHFISAASSNRYVVKPESSKKLGKPPSSKKDASAYLNSFPFNNTQSSNLTSTSQNLIPVTTPTLNILEKKRDFN